MRPSGGGGSSADGEQGGGARCSGLRRSRRTLGGDGVLRDRALEVLGIGQLGIVEVDAWQAHLAPARRAQRLGDPLAERRHAVSAVDGERHRATD